MSSAPAARRLLLLPSHGRNGLTSLASGLFFSTPASMPASASAAASNALQSACAARPLLARASASGISPLGFSRPLCFASAPRVNRANPSWLTTRPFTSGKPFARDAPPSPSPAKTTGDADAAGPGKPESTQSQEPAEIGFGKSERASQAAQINMRARLSKEGKDKKQSFRANMQDVVRLLKIIKPEIRTLSLAIFCLLISSAVTMSLPLTIGKIMDLSTKGTIDEVRILGLNIYQFFGAFAAFLTLGAFANFGRAILLRIVGERVVARLRSQLFRKTYNQDAEFFDANRTGDLISRLGADTIIVGKSVTQNVSDGLRSAVSFSVGLGLMIWISPNLSTVLLFAGPMIGASAFFYGRITRKLSRDIQKHVGALTKIAEERLGNIKTSQAFVGEVQEVRRYNNQVRKIFNVGKTSAFWDASFFGSSGWMGNMTLLALLWFSGGLVRDGLLSLGDLTTFMMYAAFAGSSLVGVGNFFSELMKGAGAADRLFELQDRKPLIPSTIGVKVKSAQGPIRFDGVTFAYPTRPAVTIFNGLDFEIPSGSNVCIVGPSGGGKSTISSLLLRFYDTTSGKITINGTDISKMNIKSLRRRIGFVSQEPVLFSGTIAENVAYGRPDASRSEIVVAAQKANCQFISDFPQGLETQVGPRGAQLSGGQKQRIAIARALLKDPDILILDEATSALDAESETLVNAALAELLKGRSTTISIAHRLSTIKRSDQIIVLNNKGTVAEMGSYATLNADKESAFSRLMEWQQTGGEINPNVVKRHGPHILESEVINHELENEEHEEHEEHDGQSVEHQQGEETKQDGGPSR